MDARPALCGTIVLTVEHFMKRLKTDTCKTLVSALQAALLTRALEALPALDQHHGQLLANVRQPYQPQEHVEGFPRASVSKFDACIFVSIVAVLWGNPRANDPRGDDVNGLDGLDGTCESVDSAAACQGQAVLEETYIPTGDFIE